MPDRDIPEDERVFEQVSAGLARAQRMLRSLPADHVERAALERRLVAVATTAKHDLYRASERLNGLLEEVSRAVHGQSRCDTKKK